MKYDDLFEYVGQIGVYQWLISILCFMFSVFGVESIAMIFIAHGQDHWCHVEELQDLPHNLQQYISSPWEEDGVYSSCIQYTLNYSQ